MSLTDVSGYLETRDGFCHPDWAGIRSWLEGNFPESEWSTGWEAVVRQWVARLRDQLGGDYKVHETPHFLVLSNASSRVIRDACSFYEHALAEIRQIFHGVTHEEEAGHVVLMFGELDDYYRYVMHFAPDGEHPMTGGVFLDSGGYPHFALPLTDYSSYRRVLVHELTHGCLAHLGIPPWLNEALAMRTEEVICRVQNFVLDRELHQRHLAHWNAETIQQFWSGRSWDIPGESFELAYNLAQVLWRKIEGEVAPTRTLLAEFLRSARADDAGEAACQSVFGFSLADFATDFLGEGDWLPQPQK
jgi:hypothetical protein